jgi:hypothetical protein
VVDHVVSRTVRDSAAMLDATGYPDPAAPYPAPPKAGPYLDEVGRNPGRLRIAWSSETPSGRPIDPEGWGGVGRGRIRIARGVEHGGGVADRAADDVVDHIAERVVEAVGQVRIAVAGDLQADKAAAGGGDAD